MNVFGHVELFITFVKRRLQSLNNDSAEIHYTVDQHQLQEAVLASMILFSCSLKTSPHRKASMEIELYRCRVYL